MRGAALGLVLAGLAVLARARVLAKSPVPPPAVGVHPQIVAGALRRRRARVDDGHRCSVAPAPTNRVDTGESRHAQCAAIERPQQQPRGDSS